MRTEKETKRCRACLQEKAKTEFHITYNTALGKYEKYKDSFETYLKDSIYGK